MFRLSVLLLLAGPGALVTAPQAQHAPRAQRAPRSPALTLARLKQASTLPAGSIGLEYDPLAYEQLAELHRLHASFTLDDLPLPGGETIDVELLPVDVLEPGAEAVVMKRHGEVLRLAPRVLSFSGFTSSGGPAFLGVSEEAWNGYVVVDGSVFFLSPGEHALPGEVVLSGASSSAGAMADFCGLNGLTPPPPSVEQAVATPWLRTANVFVEADNRVRDRFESDQACVDYVTLLYTAVSEIYRRDVGVRLRIPDGYLRVWDVVPPWGTITALGNIDRVHSWWNSTANPLHDIPRASVTVLTSPVMGGVARGVGGLCDNTRAFQLASIAGRFPYPIQHRSRDNWDLFVVAHELGHTFGSMHSDLYSPPIECADGSGPDFGTIMSYCHIDYGVAGVGMRFHVREQQRIRSAFWNTDCLTFQQLVPGDYDADGDRDANDLAAAHGVAEQGFRSLSSEEVFDMDRDGDFDDADLQQLTWLAGDDSQATSSVRNGSGVNPDCYSAVTRPILGSNWLARVEADGVKRLTCVTVCLDALPGVDVGFGELLVRTAPFGGMVLLRDFSTSNGIASLHGIPLPLDTALVGLSAATQALVLEGSDGMHLCNAIDLVFGSW